MPKPKDQPKSGMNRGAPGGGGLGTTSEEFTPEESQEAEQERIYGAKNLEYDLISIIYHSLQGAETYLEYLADADGCGDEELIAFLHEVVEQERERAARAKRILARHLSVPATEQAARASTEMPTSEGV